MYVNSTSNGGCNVLQVPIQNYSFGDTKAGKPSPPWRIKIVMACLQIIFWDEFKSVCNSPLRSYSPTLNPTNLIQPWDVNVVAIQWNLFDWDYLKQEKWFLKNLAYEKFSGSTQCFHKMHKEKISVSFQVMPLSSKNWPWYKSLNCIIIFQRKHLSFPP